MIDEGIASGKYVETSDTTHADSKPLKTSFIDILNITNVMMKSTLFQTNRPDSLLPLRHINSSQ